MLQTADVIAGKVIVQLGLAPAEEVRAELRALDTPEPTARDLVNRLTARRNLDPKKIEVIRHRVALYEHVRAEAVYLRLLESSTHVERKLVARLINELERTAYRRRLGDVLVRSGKLTREQHLHLFTRQRATLKKDDVRILERYRSEDFAGVGKPLIPYSSLSPNDFKISTLFRGKETRALVDQAEIEALGREARKQREGGAAGADLGHQPPLAGADDDDLPDAVSVAPDAAPAASVNMERVKTLKRIADYSIVEVLGCGGMGAVFLGQKDGAGEYAAIKVMLNLAATDAEKGRFKREIALTKNFRHKNVIGIIDAGETPDGMTYLVVPALVGKELRALLDEQGKEGLDPDQACHIFEQVLEGMQAIHDLKIVHRDMKPENVFLSGAEYTAKIMDFGLAKLYEELDDAGDATFKSRTGEVVGSPMYIAPESITSDPIDHRTDIYSLGIVFFEMLTGKLPLDSETPQGFLTQHIVCPPLTLAEARPERKWPESAETLIARMMGKSRDERPASCNEILAFLRGNVRAELKKVETPAATPLPEPTAVEPAPEAKQKKFGFKGLLGRLLNPA